LGFLVKDENMKITAINFILIIALMVAACTGSTNQDKQIDEDQLGFIIADVSSEETNLRKKATIPDDAPGFSEKVNRAFENAPPLIPHTTAGFLPIKIKSNICLSCHMPEKAEEINGVALPDTHFTNLRPDLNKNGELYTADDSESVHTEKMTEFNNAYFNCSQCHVPQTKITAEIENLFTPEFREEFGLTKSDLDKRIEEGIK